MSGFKLWLCHLLAVLPGSDLVSFIYKMIMAHLPYSLLYALHELAQVKST